MKITFLITLESDGFDGERPTQDDFREALTEVIMPVLSVVFPADCTPANNDFAWALPNNSCEISELKIDGE